MNYKILTRYGLYSSGLLMAFSLATLALFGLSSDNYDIGEIFGYTSIALSLVFVFFGIKHYRDQHLNGTISFWQSLKVGLLIALFPAMVFGLYNILYAEVIDPEFMDKYYQHQLTKMEASMSASQFELARSDMDSEKEFFLNPAVQFSVMFLTVWLMGLIVSIVSSFSLVKNKIKQQNGK